ncbi:MAG: Ig-like domain-containing protein [Saprospiraceae bacterium]
MARRGDVKLKILEQGGTGKPYVFQVEYQPEPGFIGVDSFTVEFRYPNTFPFQVYRGYRVCVQRSLVKAAPDFAITARNTPVIIDVLHNDSGDWGPLQVLSIPLSNNGTATILGSDKIEFLPSPGFSGIAHVQYTVCDALFSCQTTEVTIGVNKGTPSQGDLQLFTNKNRVVSSSLDFDGYSILSSPEHGSLKLENNGQSFSYQPQAGFSGTDEFKLKVVFDGQEYIKPVAVKVYNTESPNQMAMDDVVVTPVNTPVSFNVRSNDIGNLMVRNWLVPTDFPGKLSNTTGIGNVTFTPNPGFSGVATFTYKLGNLFNTNIETATVTVIVDDLEPEEEFPHVFSTPEETALTLNYNFPFPIQNLAIDIAPNHGVLELQSANQQPGGNTQDLTANFVLTYIPKQHFHGDDEFVLRYCLPNGHCYSSKIRIEVLEMEDLDPPYCTQDCVWPGDINGDGIINNKDLLPLAYALGHQGTQRLDASDKWYGHFSDNWEIPFSGLPFDLKHADADGNGRIDSEDIEIIKANYNRANNIYPKSYPTKKGLPFFLNLLTPNPKVGDLVRFEVLLGNQDFPAIDVYGFTFDLALSQGLVDSAFKMTYLENSWLNRDAPYISLAARPQVGKFETAFSRANSQPISGEGVVGIVEFVIIDIVDGGGQNNRPNITLNPSISLSDGSSTTGEPYVFEFSLESEERSSRLTEEGDFSQLLALFPSPTSDVLNIQLAGNQEITEISVFDLNGEQVLTRSGLSGNRVQLDINELPIGLYILSVQTNDGVYAEKFQVIR